MSKIVKMLDRYKVERMAGMSAAGPEQLVILTLKPNGELEYPPVAISKMDAMILSLQLSNAAADAQGS